MVILPDVTFSTFKTH